MFGYVVFMYGGPVSFVAKRLKVVATSSAEAEYAGGMHACKELAFVRGVLRDLGHSVVGPIVLAVDNQAAIRIAEDIGVTARNKHFTEVLHYFRDQTMHNLVKPVYVKTGEQLADGFTKPLGKGVFGQWRARLLE